MPTSWFFRLGDEGIHYRTAAEVVEFLRARPQAVADYRESMLAAMRVSLSWGDYKGARETFTMLCDVLQTLDTLAGRNILT